MEVQLRPLTIDLNKLNGLSPRLIASHHENNYAGAVKRLNAIRGQLSALDWGTAPVFAINGLKREELIAANSAWLHELYFDVLGGDGVLPACGLSVAIERDFGSVALWRSEFSALAKAMGGGSGWALLSWSSREGRLINHWASDHTQLLAGATPILALDMYEHAYHMDFGAKAAAYVDATMNNVDWAAVYRRYGAAIMADAMALASEPGGTDLASAQLIDVRRDQDFAAGEDMIAGARWRNPAEVSDWHAELAPGRPVLVYCVKGLDIGRSAALALRARGVDARYLVGGINAWRAAGLPVEPKQPEQGGQT